MVYIDIQIILRLALVFLGILAGILAFLLYPTPSRKEKLRAQPESPREYQNSVTEFTMLLGSSIIVWGAFILFTGGSLVGSSPLLNTARLFFIIPLIIFIIVLFRWWRRFGW